MTYFRHHTHLRLMLRNHLNVHKIILRVYKSSDDTHKVDAIKNFNKFPKINFNKVTDFFYF